MIIRDLLGHASIKTTQRYIKISKKQLLNTPNPLDDFYNANKEED